MKQSIYQVDAFTDQLFGGNPAAVCVMERWPDDRIMQQIALENNLAETAFLVKNGSHYTIRWFTPEIEVDLCGHATLASAYVLFTFFEVDSATIHFYSPRSGKLTVQKGADDFLIMDFPTDELKKVEIDAAWERALGKAPIKAFKGKTDYLLIYSSQKNIEGLQPDFFLINKIAARGIIVSAPGELEDFVSRFFAPQSGIMEDPVTGSAHTSLTPYWAKELGKSTLTAKQLSARGGYLRCEYLGDRVKIAGKAVLYMTGEILLA